MKDPSEKTMQDLTKEMDAHAIVVLALRAEEGRMELRAAAIGRGVPDFFVNDLQQVAANAVAARLQSACESVGVKVNKLDLRSPGMN